MARKQNQRVAVDKLPQSALNRVVIISDGVVINAVKRLKSESVDGVTEIISATAQIGDTYSGGVFTPPGPDLDEEARQATIAAAKVKLDLTDEEFAVLFPGLVS